MSRKKTARPSLEGNARLGQFVLAVLQCIGHGVERGGDPREFGLSPDVHAPGKFAEPPLVRGVDQLA
jgi:hypothetical protein